MTNYNKVPVHYMLSGMQRYVEQGIPPGDFLSAIAGEIDTRTSAI